MRNKSSSGDIVPGMSQLNLSARAYHRTRSVKLARTIADLAGSEDIQSAHLAEALHSSQLSNVNDGMILNANTIDIQSSHPYNPHMTIRILLVDDHNVVRQGLRMFLALDPDLVVVGEASNGAEGIEQVRKLDPDIVLMDLLMPVMDGITAIGQLRKEFPDIEVIALTSILEDDKVIGAVRAGAIGYLLKDTQADELCKAIKAAAQGQVQLSPQATARLVREIKAPDSPEKLTERETDVLRLLALGHSNKEIANELVIGEKTVKTHVSNILMKLNLTSRTQAALHAVRIGLVSQ